MTLTRRALASRENGLLGGVKTPEGKAISRFNARGHGIFAEALGAQEAEDFEAIEGELIGALQPAARMEELLVGKLALTYLRMFRCAKAEAKFDIVAAAPDRAGYGVDAFVRMVSLFDLYDARLTNQFMRLLHEVERLQRLRAGEDVPPPVVADVSVETDSPASLQTDETARVLPGGADASAKPQGLGSEGHEAQRAI